MIRVKLGKYRLLEQSYVAAAHDQSLDLSRVSTDDLEALPGFGKKSSRFLIVHSRPDMDLAVIDTHVLKYLREVGAPSVPDTIPSGEEYLRLERLILAEAAKYGMKPHVFDLAVWSWYSSGNKGMPILAGSVPQPNAATARTVTSPSDLPLLQNCPDVVRKGSWENDITAAT
jgi:hypothetical protein